MALMRGDWGDDPIGGYKSDYDILVVVSDDRLAESEFWSSAEDRLMRDLTISGTLTAPVNFIVHCLNDANAQLERGRPFFIDIVAQDVGLYEAEGFRFAQPRTLPPSEALAEAIGYFDKWFSAPSEFFGTARFAAQQGWKNQSAFLFHQTVEQFITAPR